MDLSDRRQERLRELVRQRGSQAKLAEITGIDATSISRMLSRGRNRKKIGEDSARVIEQKCELPQYWLDHADLQVREPQPERRWPYNFERMRLLKLTPHQRKTVEDMLTTLLNSFERSHDPPKRSKKAGGRQ